MKTCLLLINLLIILANERAGKKEILIYVKSLTIPNSFRKNDYFQKLLIFQNTFKTIIYICVLNLKPYFLLLYIDTVNSVRQKGYIVRKYQPDDPNIVRREQFTLLSTIF
jgi:hypothetical protein